MYRDRVNKGFSGTMDDTARVYTPQHEQRIPKSFRYPRDRVKLLELVAVRQGATFSNTVAAACDRLIEEHYPGALKGAA